MSFSTLNELLLAIILGIVQGITEFLPISSTAHLRLISEFLVHKDIGLAASNLIQMGTLVAILQYFWPELRNLFLHIIKVFSSKKDFSECCHNITTWITGKSNFRDEKEADLDILIAQVIIATLPIVIFALLVRDQVELLRENILNIAYFLLAGGLLISISELVHKNRKNSLKPSKMGVWEVLVIGGCQCLAVFPGISRSGATLAGALFLGRNRQESVRFSFLLSIPALGLAGVYDLIKIIKEMSQKSNFILPNIQNWSENTIDLSLISLIIAFLLAYLFGLICLKWLLKYLATNSARVFIVYRICLASLIFGIVYWI